MADDWAHDGAMPIRILREPTDRAAVKALAGRQFGDFIKAVVDCARGYMAIGAELHSDEESVLLADGSVQSDLWGINLYPDIPGDDWVEFDSLINLRPGAGNVSRGVDDPATRKAVLRVVRALVRDAG